MKTPKRNLETIKELIPCDYNADGRQFVITMDDADETSDESLPTIEDIFDDIPEW